MHNASPLPNFLIERHLRWRGELQPEVNARLGELADHGQSPPSMIIACCDSRVMAADVFGAEPGEIFVHRNIANLVPPYQPDGMQRGTSATVEFAVKALKVKHLIVMGHFGCGGVEGCMDMHCHPERESDLTFVEQWLEILEPRVEPVLQRGLERQEALRALEHEAILLSIRNLMTFPFVAEAVERGELQLHGIWNYIKDGILEYYDAGQNRFVEV